MRFKKIKTKIKIKIKIYIYYSIWPFIIEIHWACCRLMDHSASPAWTPGAFYDGGGVMGRVVGRLVWVLWGICGLGVGRGPHEPPASIPEPHHPPPQNDTHPQHKHSETSIGEVVSTNGVELDAALDALGKKAGAQEVAARQEKLEKAVAEVREEVWLVLVVLWWRGFGLVW